MVFICLHCLQLMIGISRTCSNTFLPSANGIEEIDFLALLAKLSEKASNPVVAVVFAVNRASSAE
jgi:hypothetical protein